MQCLLLVVLAAFAGCCIAEEDNIIVISPEAPLACTEGGCYRGTLMPGGHSRIPFDAFLGIPFAKPPVGSLRFANPEPLNETWTEPRDASQAATECIQKNALIPNPIVTGSEDCLYLNVYRPSELDENTTLPVIVFIHGGGFFAGSAHPDQLGPEYFMDTCEVVMVTIAYRLGAMGFLSTGDAEAPGNFGLKDQAVALQWVQDNIEYFNGNASSVTLMGVSAGAASVHMHMTSPLSRDLFHKAVSMSGNAFGPYNIPTKNPLELATRQAEVLGINTTMVNTTVLVTELRKVEAWQIVNSSDQLKVWSDDPLTLFRPVVEAKFSTGAFLTIKDEIKLLKPSKTIPWIQTVVQNEGAVRAAAILTNPELLEQVNERFDELLPKILELDNLKPNAAEDVLTKIKNQYFDGNSSVCAGSQRFVDLYTDFSFYYPLYKAVHKYLKLGDPNKSSIYMYRFLYKGPISYSRIYTRTSTDFGVVHLDDTIYLFKTNFFVPFDDCSHHVKVTETLVKFFTDFAATGEPTKLAPIRQCSKKTTEHGKRFCDYYELSNGIDGELAVKPTDAFDFNMVAFWDDIVKTVVTERYYEF